MVESGLKVITLQQAQRKREIASLIREVVNLDYLEMNDLLKVDEGSGAHWMAVLKKSPNSVRYLVNNGKIVGYWHFVAPTLLMYRKILKGRLVDGQIRAKDIRAISRPGFYNLYSIEWLLVPELRDGRGIKLLCGSFYDVVEAMAKKGVFFQNHVTNAYTRDGLKVVKRWGMDYVTENRSKGDIYAMPFYDFLLGNAVHRKKLIALYKKALDKEQFKRVSR